MSCSGFSLSLSVGRAACCKPQHTCCCLLPQESATAGPACITSADGSCLIDLVVVKAQQQKAAANAAGNSLFQPSAESATYSAVITAGGHGPLVVPDLPNSGRFRSSGPSKDYVATLVLDRKLVKPGDDLHVTGGGCRRACSCFY